MSALVAAMVRELDVLFATDAPEIRPYYGWAPGRAAATEEGWHMACRHYMRGNRKFINVDGQVRYRDKATCEQKVIIPLCKCFHVNWYWIAALNVARQLGLTR